MGVKRLKKYLEKGKCRPSLFEFTGNTCLLVDGLGWLFSVLNKSCKSCKDRQFGGSYGDIATYIGDEILYLQGMGLKLIFFFDGEDSRMKDATAEIRKKNRENIWLNMLQFSRCKTYSGFKLGDLPIPPLSLNQLKFILHSFHIEVITTEFEADQDIASICQCINSSSSVSYFCYGNDR
jgi:hypothetical protein